MSTKPYLLEKLRNNCIRTAAFTAFILTGALTTMAHQLTPAQAIARMQSQSKGIRRVNGNKQLQLKYTESKGDTALVYVMSAGNESGIYILSADDCAPAVLGWTEGGDADSIPEAMKWWISQYSENISDAIQNEQVISTSNASQAVVPPLLSTTWGQGAPYNALCTDDDNYYQTGCIATAMAQIMNYYQHPAKGSGSHSYVYDGVTFSSNFSEHTYQWDQMQNSYSSNYTGSQSEKAVSQLMRDCGVSLEMNYSVFASSAANAMFSYALPTYFGYDKGITNVYRKDKTDAEWTEILINELQQGRPIFYCGVSSYRGGHAFICDGYQGNGYFHFNWGWNGKYNGYFVVNGTRALNPYGSFYPSECYTLNQMITIGIKPEEGGQKQTGYLEFLTEYQVDATNLSTTKKISLSNHYLINRSVSPMRATLGVLLKDGDKEYCLSGSGDEVTYNLTQSYSPNYEVFITDDVEDGTYEVYPIFMDLDEDEPTWNLVEFPDNATVPTIVISNQEPEAQMCCVPFAHNDGVRNINNKVTEDGLTVRLEMDALRDIKDLFISCDVYSTETNSKVASCQGNYSANAGEKLVVDMKPCCEMRSLGLEEGSYEITLKCSNSSIIPEEYSSIPVEVVDHMPTLSDIAKKIQKLQTGECTKKDVEDTVFEVLNTESVNK